MTVSSEELSAYLDGELPAARMAEIDRVLEDNPALQAEIEALMAADAIAQAAFEAELRAPVPLNLIRQIKEAPLQPHGSHNATRRIPLWGSLAAGLVALMIGGLGGYSFNSQTTPVPDRPGWIATVAEYHAVYAGQTRHLVEVGADETAHLKTWLGKTVGTTFEVPDLGQFGLTFEGGRLVVAGGKPVAQLMYTGPDGTVVALCLQSSDKDLDTPTDLKTQTIGAFDVVSWSAGDADYVVIGPSGLQGLAEIAAHAALNV